MATQSVEVGLAQYLIETFKMREEVARQYAHVLEAENYDTPALFETLSLSELQKDFGELCHLFV